MVSQLTNEPVWLVSRVAATRAAGSVLGSKVGRLLLPSQPTHAQ